MSRHRARVSHEDFDYKLVRALRHPVREYAAMAADVLGNRGHDRTIKALQWAVLKRSDSLVRSSALRALARFRDERAYSTIRACLNDRDALVRREARKLINRERRHG
jgi:HEAT repeat protein